MSSLPAGPPPLGDVKKKQAGEIWEKTAERPGFHLNDWKRQMKAITPLVSDPSKLPLITRSELASHCSKFDCWTAYNGKVYNITQYLVYHPGGEARLMEGAGKDCTELFNTYHKWVNCSAIIGRCIVGILKEESASEIVLPTVALDMTTTESSAAWSTDAAFATKVLSQALNNLEANDSDNEN